MTSSVRVRAPELTGAGGWLNTDGPVSLAELRGRVVLLDFWTFCCGNCLHVLDELRALEQRFGDDLVVIGVHSPKFEHERDHAAVAAAVERYEVHHPVLDDPDLSTWRQYAVKAWPTLTLIDPEGYVVAQAAGEGQTYALALLIDQLLTTHAERGTLRRGDSPYRPPAPEPSTLRFPAKAVILPAARTGRDADTVLVADAGHHCLVELATDGTAVRRFGTGGRGRTDGPSPQFAEPNGAALLPDEVAAAVGYDVLVADTANHLLRGVRLLDGDTSTVADLANTGLHTITGPVPAVTSPWDVAWWPAVGKAVVAAAGVHLLLMVDLSTSEVSLLAGTTVEGVKDGPALDGWLAQPSGLAVDGDTVWFVDAETSALRRLAADGHLSTAVGEGLFDFGHVDGAAPAARLQHPLGVTVLPDGSVAVLDTYNGAVRRYDPSRDEVTTLSRDLQEPSGAVLVDGGLLVVESAAHRLVLVPLDEAITHHGDAQRTTRPVTRLRAGVVELVVPFDPPPGRKVDDRYGPPTRLAVSASPPELLLDGAGGGTELRRRLRLADGVEGVLHVTAQAASCDSDGDEHAACYLARQDWGVPVRVAADGAAELILPLLG